MDTYTRIEELLDMPVTKGERWKLEDLREQLDDAVALSDEQTKYVTELWEDYTNDCGLA